MHRMRCIWPIARSIRPSPAHCAAPLNMRPSLTGQALKISQRLNALNERIKAEQADVNAPPAWPRRRG